MVENPNQAVIFIFYDQHNNAVLMEQRSPESSFYPGEAIFPGGKADQDELGDPLKTLLREVKEELGDIKIINHTFLTRKRGRKGYDNKQIHIAIIEGWNGHIPKTSLDKGTPLIWRPLSSVKEHSLIIVREMYQLIIKHLKQ